MLKQDNPGFLAEEIANLKVLCAAENKSFIVIDDEDLPMGNDKEMVHIQFVGHYMREKSYTMRYFARFNYITQVLYMRKRNERLSNNFHYMYPLKIEMRPM